ncbi:MAG: hypothetical protein V1753_00375 [Pseudomonadota bacterium]
MISSIFFDTQDHHLIKIVNEVLNRDTSRQNLKKLLNPYLHPHGIKEMAAPQSLRVAYALINVLNSLDMDKTDDRLTALRVLRDEVLNIPHISLRKNAGRVLIQIMKELIRIQGDYKEQLRLTHDFRIAVTGKPRLIRYFLRQHHLLEMPEEWNQIAFDDHVHDAHTKGRKSPCHLIMDAWIKGIKNLTVIHYNYIQPEVAAELLEAGAIMGVRVKIGIEFSARFRNRYVQLIWMPPDYPDSQNFLNFLAEPLITSFMNENRLVSEYQQRYVFSALNEFNEQHRHVIGNSLGIAEIPELSRSAFLEHVGAGQASLLHLGRFIHGQIMELAASQIKELKKNAHNKTEADQLDAGHIIHERLKELDSEAIVDKYLRPSQNPLIQNPSVPSDDTDVPWQLRLSPGELVERLRKLHSEFHITLNLSKLNVEDVLEIIYDCQGMISHLEAFNLKDYVDGHGMAYAEISNLQHAINCGNVITLKQGIQNIISRVEQSNLFDKDKRSVKLKKILRDIPALLAFYKNRPIKSCIGTDSTGYSYHLHGMGLVVKETLPRHVQQQIRRALGFLGQTIPIKMIAHIRRTYIACPGQSGILDSCYKLARLIPGFQWFGYKHINDWIVEDSQVAPVAQGNIIPLGGTQKETQKSVGSNQPSIRHLNSTLKNWLKILGGFIPSFLTFSLTKDWWLLAYGGAFIWFGITGLRNVLQAVLGGGGLRRSPFLHWNDYISWNRLADSLLFTGFSVPLLDYVIKHLLLAVVFNITASNNPILLYSIIAIANGAYISTHNTLRGFPRPVVFGNFFRSVLSIPIAIGLNMTISAILGIAGVSAISEILQNWAAIISKTASDIVAGVIEGSADRQINIRIRSRDYTAKFTQVFEAHTQLELLYPEAKALTFLKTPKTLIRHGQGIEKILITNALDLLYMWMHQPRGQTVMQEMLKSMSNDEQQIIIRSQFVLERQKDISQLFADGIIGHNFSKAFSFYLERHKKYLNAIKQLI